MKHRFLALSVTLAAIVAGSASVASQTAPAWTPPLGPDGHPDLQGVWLNNSATPLEQTIGPPGQHGDVPRRRGPTRE